MDGKIPHDLLQLWLHLHDVSVSALAAAVATLGVVLLLELRCVVRLRGVMDNQLGRVFEQLDLLRFETRQLLEGQQSLESSAAAIAAAEEVTVTIASSAAPATAGPAQPVANSPVIAPRSAAGTLYQSAAALAAGGATSREIADRLGLAAGEARLLSSLVQARARRAEAASA